MACYSVFASCLFKNVSFCMKRVIYGCIKCNNWVDDLSNFDKKKAKQSELVSLNNKIKEEYDFI